MVRPVTQIQRRQLILAAGSSALFLAHSNTVLAQADENQSAAPKEPPQNSELLENQKKANQLVDKIVQGRTIRGDLIEATVPDIAEDGGAVPVSFKINCSMEDEDYPKTVHVIGMVNPTPEIARYHFTPMCGEAEVVFRCRMHASSNISFISVMADGTVGEIRKFVTVTAGGCV